MYKTRRDVEKEQTNSRFGLNQRNQHKVLIISPLSSFVSH